MTTDLSPSGIQRLLEMSESSAKSDVWIDGLANIARTALPDALRRIAVLQAALTAIIDRSYNIERRTSKVSGMRDIALAVLSGGNGE